MENLVYSQIVASTRKKEESAEVGIAVAIPRELKQRVDAACEQSGMKLKAFVAKALMRYVEIVEDRIEKESAA